SRAGAAPHLAPPPPPAAPRGGDHPVDLGLVLGDDDPPRRLAPQDPPLTSQEVGGGEVGLVNYPVGVRDHVAVGGEVEQLLVSLALSQNDLLGGGQLFVLPAQLLLGDAEFFQRDC